MDGVVLPAVHGSLLKQRIKLLPCVFFGIYGTFGSASDEREIVAEVAPIFGYYPFGHWLRAFVVGICVVVPTIKADAHIR